MGHQEEVGAVRWEQRMMVEGVDDACSAGLKVEHNERKK